jgi:uncharacterized metal-binding protein (TIGR02443 family)
MRSADGLFMTQPLDIRTLEDLPENSVTLDGAICPQCDRKGTTWFAEENAVSYWFCDFCGHLESETRRG